MARQEQTEERDAEQAYNQAFGDIVSGAGLIVVGFGASYIMSFGFKILAARYLGATNFGVFSVGAAIVAVGGLGVAGVDRAIARLLPRYAGGAAKRGIVWAGAKVVLAGGLGTGVLVYLMSGSIADALTNQVSDPDVIKVFAVAVPAMILMKFSIGVTRGMKWATPKVVVQRLLIPGAKLALGTVVAVVGLESMGFAWAFTGAMVLGGMTGIAFLFRSLPSTSDTRHDFGEKAILGAALPLMVVSGANILYTSIDTLMVGYFGTAGETGVYKASWTVARVTLVPLLAAAFLAMPALSEFHANEERKSVNRLYSMTVKWITLVSLPILVVFLSHAGGIMQLIYGVEYAVGGTELAILSIGFFSHCVMGNNEGLMVSIGGERGLAVISVSAMISNISLNILLIPVYGSVGAAIATAATFLIMNILISYSLNKYHGIKINMYDENAKILLALIPLVIIYILSGMVIGSQWKLILGTITMLVSYLYIVIRFGLTKEEEKRTASKIAEQVGANRAFGERL